MHGKKHNSAVDEKRKLQEVLNIGLEITQTKDIDILLERILAKARHFTNADAGSIYIKEDNTLRFRYTQNEAEQIKLPAGKKLIYSTFSIPVNNQSVSGYVANTGETLNIDDVYHLDDGVPYSFDHSYDKITGYDTKSVLAFPLKTHDSEVVGVLQPINAKNRENDIVPFERDDPTETSAHVNRVASYAVEIYEAWVIQKGIDKQQIERNKDILKIASILHDVGKVAIMSAGTVWDTPAILTT